MHTTGHPTINSLNRTHLGHALPVIVFQRRYKPRPVLNGSKGKKGNSKLYIHFCPYKLFLSWGIGHMDGQIKKFLHSTQTKSRIFSKAFWLASLDEQSRKVWYFWSQLAYLLRYNEKWCNCGRHAQDLTQREINSFWDLRSLLLRA